MGQFQYVDVQFPSGAYQDLVVPHTLRVADPEQIRWLPVALDFPTFPVTAPVIYRDTGVNRRAWTSTYLILRSNVASLRGRLLLFVEASE